LDYILYVQEVLTGTYNREKAGISRGKRVPREATARAKPFEPPSTKRAALLAK